MGLNPAWVTHYRQNKGRQRFSDFLAKCGDEASQPLAHWGRFGHRMQPTVPHPSLFSTSGQQPSPLGSDSQLQNCAKAPTALLANLHGAWPGSNPCLFPTPRKRRRTWTVGPWKKCRMNKKNKPAASVPQIVLTSPERPAVGWTENSSQRMCTPSRPDLKSSQSQEVQYQGKCKSRSCPTLLQPSA